MRKNSNLNTEELMESRKVDKFPTRVNRAKNDDSFIHSTSLY